MRVFVIWHISLILLLQYANADLRLFGSLIIGLGCIPVFVFVAKGVADAAVNQFMKRLNDRRRASKDDGPVQSNEPDPPSEDDDLEQ